MSINKPVDYYKILQVHHDAGHDIIDAAYRCLSRIYHPDVNKSPLATERMKEINIAYSVVGDIKKRKEYHPDWMSLNKRTFTAPVNETRKEEEDAMRVLDDFFCETVNERWENAYEKLTYLDKGNIPIEDFLSWKRAVAEVYKLGNYKITYFRKYTNCDYAGVIYKTILQFSVQLTEMKVSNMQINDETTEKYVAFDGSSWRVCLGYTDLKPAIMKFKHIAQAVPKLDKEKALIKAVEKIDLLTGLYNLNGFVEQAEREMMRSQRYGNPLSLAVIKIEPIQDNKACKDNSYRDACISYAAEILYSNIRRTDLIGRCDACSFAILLTETRLQETENILSKLLNLCDSSEYLDFRIYTASAGVYEGKMEQIIELTLANVSLREKECDLVLNESLEQVQTKLGKYRLTDILSFNRRGKNHF